MRGGFLRCSKSKNCIARKVIFVYVSVKGQAYRLEVEDLDFEPIFLGARLIIAEDRLSHKQM